mmetsp:Transcript_71327/g.198945  ORF Transcript_71327/g.198945 Transcript_71327/m.198945 type:complete len:686 (-) Transcript_71327:715-2772(-)
MRYTLQRAAGGMLPPAARRHSTEKRREGRPSANPRRTLAGKGGWRDWAGARGGTRGGHEEAERGAAAAGTAADGLAPAGARSPGRRRGLSDKGDGAGGGRGRARRAPRTSRLLRRGARRPRDALRQRRRPLHHASSLVAHRGRAAHRHGRQPVGAVEARAVPDHRVHALVAHHAGAWRHRLPRGRVLERKGQLHRLLRALVHHLLPQLALMADAVQLAFDVLLGDLEEAQHRVVGLLAHQVEDAAVLLRRQLPPRLLHAGGEVLRAVLPVQQLNVHIKLLLAAVVYPGTGKHADHLAKLHSAACQLGSQILERLKTLLVHLLVQLLVDTVHVLLVPLRVFRALALELAQIVAAFSDVHVVRRALDREVVNLVPELAGVPLQLAAGPLQPAQTEVQRVQALRGLLRDVRVVALERVHAVLVPLVQLLVLLREFGLARPHHLLGLLRVLVDLVQHLLVDLLVLQGTGLEHADLLEGFRETPLRRLPMVLVLLLELVVVGLYLVLKLLGLAPDQAECLVDLPAASVGLEAEGGGHVAYRLHRLLVVIVRLVPRRNVYLVVELVLGLVAHVRNVLGQLVAALVRLLQALRHVLHPGVMGLQGFLHVTHVQTHGGDLRCHSRLHALPRSDDRVRRVHPRTHLVEIYIHGVHGSCEVLHVALASKHDALDLSGVVLVTIDDVLQLTEVVLD